MQLRVMNFGGSLARDIHLKWDEPILDAQGQQVRFAEQQGAPDITVLLPNQSVAIPLGLDSEMYREHKVLNYSGMIEYKNPSGKKLKHRFYLSIEQYRNASSYEEEALKTHYQLQKIPEELKKLN